MNIEQQVKNLTYAAPEHRAARIKHLRARARALGQLEKLDAVLKEHGYG